MYDAATSVTEELRRLAPRAFSLSGADADCRAAFRAIAELLLDRTRLVVAGRAHRLTELEVYYDGPSHPDPFTHGDPMQRELGRWYFHRQGGTYRGGTYKGVDIAFGSPEACAGMLVRGMAALDGDELVDGPCLVVDRMLALTSHASVADLAGSFAGAIDPARGSPLYLELAAPRGATVYATPRIGLTLKKGATPARRSYLARAYRFLTEPARIKKGRPHLVVALHRDGLAPDAIAALARCRRVVVDAYLEAYRSGLGGAPESFADDVCALLGACAELSGCDARATT